MKSMFTLAAALTLPVLAGAAQAACTLEAEPAIPDGKTATAEALKTAVTAIKASQVTLAEYRDCLGTERAAADDAAPEDEPEDAKKARASAETAAYNQSVEKEEALVAKYVEARKAFSAANPPK